MKTKIATALSVAGVLTAGSAAALVNTQILDGGAAESAASAAVLPSASTIDVTIPDVPAKMVSTNSTAPTTEPTTESTTPPTSAPAPEPTGYLTAFNVGDAGVVTVDVIDGLIVLVKSEPKSGWTISEATEDADENEVEVEFRSGTVRVEFEAAFIDGQIVPKVTSRRVGGTSSPSGTPAPPGTAPATTIAGSDDHDDDGYDDDHDDDGEHEDESEDESEDEPEDEEGSEDESEDEEDEPEDEEDEDRDDD